MRKVLIFGNSSSGKSTFAKQLCRTHTLSHLDLDTVAWQPTEPPTRQPMDSAVNAIQLFIQSNPSWVIEGCYTDLLELALPFTDEIIYLNVLLETCIAHAKARPWEPHKYPSKQAQDDRLDMLIQWISNYHQRTDTFSEQVHRAFFKRFQGKKTMYTG